MTLRLPALLVVLATALSAAAEGTDWTAAADADFRQIVLSCDGGSAADLRCAWTALRDGVPFATGRFQLPRLKPGETVTNAMPGVMRARSDHAARSLRLRFLAPADPERGTPERVLAVRQIDGPEVAPRPIGPVVPNKAPAFAEEGGRWTFEASEVFCALDRANGALVSYKTGRWSRSEWLAAPVVPALPGDLKLTKVGVSEPVATNGAWEITVHGVAQGAAPDVAYDVWTRWSVRGDGLVANVTEMRPMGRPLAGTFGWRFALAPKEPLVTCFAKAPYWDIRTLGAEAFACAAVRGLAYDAGWDHFSVAAGNRPFALEVKGNAFCVKGETDYLGDARLAFVIRPQKHFKVSALPSAAFPPTRRRIEH